MAECSAGALTSKLPCNLVEKTTLNLVEKRLAFDVIDSVTVEARKSTSRGCLQMLNLEAARTGSLTLVDKADEAHWAKPIESLGV
jgi:hypothetical protein